MKFKNINENSDSPIPRVKPKTKEELERLVRNSISTMNKEIDPLET